jgi:heme/copper-type cytochrome/quinol oxidase subunit 3
VKPPEPQLAETPGEVAFEQRAVEGAMWTGARLLIGIFAFFFASLAFAYFYLRAANSEDLWRPHGVTAPTSIGAAIALLAVVSAGLVAFGTVGLKSGRTRQWEAAGWVAFIGVLTAVALQIFELTDLPFYPGSSGYASCLVGWASMNIFVLLCGAYWIETLLASSIRLRRAVADDGGAAGAPLPSARRFRVNAEGCAYFFGLIALVSLVFWTLFYLA